MQTIENRKVKIEHISGSTIESTYLKWISEAINIAPQGGFTVDEMRTRLLLSEKVSIAIREEKALEVDLAETTKIKELMKAMPFVVLDKQILEFLDYINSL